MNRQPGARVVQAAALSSLTGDVTGEHTDVSNYADVERLRDVVFEHFGEVAFLLNNAGTGGGGDAFSRLAQLLIRAQSRG